jgi:dTDP-4-amino-4,6-dideoxygalactose transaminase
MAGAFPVLVDINEDTYTIDPSSLDRTIHEVGGVKAVVVVHLYGQPANMPSILAIARKHNAFVVEDCSQAHGATLDGRAVGGVGDIGTFSFYPTKNLGALGDGGMVVSNDPLLVQRVRSLRQYGWERRYVSEVSGVNSRLDELQAAVLRTRLPYLDRGNERRRSIAATYTEDLENTRLILPVAVPAATHVYHQFVVRSKNRDKLQESLREHGIGTNIHYPVPVHLQPAYASRCLIDPRGLDITERVANEVLSLPMYPELSDSDIAAVIFAVRNSIS